MDKNFEVDSKELFDAQYIFIDGPSRAGKGGIAPIICSFERVEHMNGNFNFDRTLPLFETGNLSLSGFKYFLESDLLIDSWYRLMGRDLNMNKHDYTSIVNSARFEEYKARLNTKDTEETFKEIELRINRDKIIFPYVSEEMLPLASIYPSVFEKIKILLVLRHPIEIIFSWHRSKRGARIGIDRRMPHPTFSVRSVKHIPSYAVDIAEQFASENPLGKSCLAVISMYRSYLDALSKCEVPLISIDFDDFAQNHESYIAMLEKFVISKRTSFTERALERTRIPRKLDHNLFSVKAAAIFANSSPSLHQEIINLSQSYEKLFPTCPFRLSKPTVSEITKYKDINFSDITPQPAYVDGMRKN